MNCAQFAAGLLQGDGGADIEMHARNCAPCRATAAELLRLRDAIDDPMVWRSPSAEMRDRVLGAVQRAQAADPIAPRSRRGRTRWWLAGAAALLLAAALAALSLLGGGAAGPDWQVGLVGANGSSASVSVAGWNEAQGTRLHLTIDGLAAAGDGAYYAIWLSSAAGEHVPAGTFRGSGEIDTWVAVRRADYPRVWITLEPADGDESLSGPTVFDTAGYAGAGV